MESNPTHIINALKAGNKLALSQLYDRYSNVIYGCVIEVVKDEALAQEALQDTFVKVWQKIDQFDPEKSRFFSWIFKIARNTAIDKLRAKRKYEELDSSNSAFGYVLENKYDSRMDTEQMLGDLEEGFEEVLRLSYIQGYSQSEISKLLQIPLGTVKSKIRLGLAKLRKRYSAGGVLLLVGIFQILLG